MTTITNDIIIKAAKAAGLGVREKLHNGVMLPMLFRPDGGATFFFPKNNDTDNAIIMDGAEISIHYVYNIDSGWVNASKGYTQRSVEILGSKSQARRDAVILCAAAKWDAMNGGVKC